MTMYVKLAAVALILALCSGLYLTGHHMGASAVQAKWDAQKRLDAVAVAKVEAASQQHAKDTSATFGNISDTFKAITHEPTVSIADGIPAAVSAGTLRLRDNPVCRGNVSAVTARSRAADAAFAAALEQRRKDAIAAVSVSDASDKREADFRALIVSLRALLAAERR